ncbi:YhjD/YihY/BrkB family envelope integrity protein [Horticoccus sp. 23ND18S-11]|uniref:YhjD/YihY/BrkB family envelope integrity protein n=1 Tax=Horticoccus sp. 23ND18S-11 TaxID=3391832 RepID=UPI0039C97F3A
MVHVYHREIWQSLYLKDRSLRGCTYAVLRVLSITITAFFESRIATRAAALSFSSLLGLGPLLVIAVLVAGFALGQTPSDDPTKIGETSRKTMVADTLNQLIKVVAPQIAQYEQVTQTANEVNPQLVEIIDNIITSSRSGSAGAAGIFSLLLIVLLLFKSVEDTFNDIWGVRQGRSVLMRVVLYWTILTLGAILFFTAVAMLSAGTLVSVFFEKTPEKEALKSLGVLVQMFSFTMLALILTLFYRVIPNTRVFWRGAFSGGLVVAALLFGNNLVQFFYVKRVVLERSLYGSLAIVPVLMFGLYIFWLFVLIGGVVSYAVQNVHFRNSQAAWSTLTESMRERLTLVVFLTICRRFRECLPPISASMLSTLLKVPTQLLNECLNRLVQLELVTTVRPPTHGAATDYLYQPARPLNRITLFDFKTLDDNLGEDPVGHSLESIDPLVSRYNAALNQIGEQEFFQKSIEALFDDHPFEESHPPFALGQRRPAK